jgi:hypothetical protein
MKISLRVAAVLLLASTLVSAQTKIEPPKNSYTPAQDVELGTKAAAEARQQLPILRDDGVTSYLEGIGQRLVSAIPADMRHPEFRYTFEPVNVREINAFALPGGPMFVNRGMMEAARNEGEVAGVMAHELSHVILRHGTAQASKAQKYQIGAAAGQILGAIIGGGWGQVVAQGSQFGLGTAFLRFSREYERQADILGSQVMARAGYDPRDMASMFKTIEKEGGPGGPQWLSDHPNPGDRAAYITKEAQMLRVENPVGDSRGFTQVQARLKQMAPAPTTEQATKNAGSRPTGTSGGETRMPTGRVSAPASSFRTYTEGDMFKVSVPSNWREIPGQSSVTFAPDGGHGQANGQSLFTHGVELGAARNETHDLETSTTELLESLAQANPGLSRSTAFDRVTLAGRPGLRTVLTNSQSATGQPESIALFTTQLRDGNLFYAVAVAPRTEFDAYRGVFDKVIRSIQLMQ